MREGKKNERTEMCMVRSQKPTGNCYGVQTFLANAVTHTRLPSVGR